VKALLASNQCVSRLIPGPGVICDLSLLLVLFSAPRWFSRTLPQESKISQIQFNTGMHGYFWTSSCELHGASWVNELFVCLFYGHQYSCLLRDGITFTTWVGARNQCPFIWRSQMSEFEFAWVVILSNSILYEAKRKEILIWTSIFMIYFICLFLSSFTLCLEIYQTVTFEAGFYLATHTGCYLIFWFHHCHQYWRRLNGMERELSWCLIFQF